MLTTLHLASAWVSPAGEPAILPGPAPGQPVAAVRSEEFELRNDSIKAVWSLKDGRFLPLAFEDLRGGKALTNLGEAFCVSLKSGAQLKASEARLIGNPTVETLKPEPSAAQGAARLAGRAVTLQLEDAAGQLGITWRTVLREDANYLREEIAFTALKADCDLNEIILLNAALPGARMRGTVDGSPVVVDNFFLGYEDPMALHEVKRTTDPKPAPAPAGAPGSSAKVALPRPDGQVTCRLPRHATLKRGETLRQRFVVGVAPAGQMRRGFLHYLERERAHPFRPYLHYNSWYDTAWNPFALNETNCLEAIETCGERLIKAHGVVMDGMVFDDGWDNPKSLWQFHGGFPRGFTPLADKCRQYQTRLGVWLSPFGGYGGPKEERLKFGRAQGYEINQTGFSLAGPKYYQAFKEACVGMIRNFGVNHFKFDGIATGMYASGGGQYILDTEAMRRLMLELRMEEPNVYVNLTTGSWPSPFWLRYADSVWRQGGDMGLAGTGSHQQQWLTYRDQETYRNIVGKGPLYPLSSLMTQGVAYSRHGTAGDPTFTSAGFKDDVRAFFGSGTGLQELYIQPGKLTAPDWAVLAEAAKWSRANAEVFVDTHWVGGDPSKLEVYGYASWSPRQAVLMLRNPDSKPREFALEAGVAFELPAGAAQRFTLHSPWAEDAAKPALTAEAGQPLRLTLQPFEVLILEAQP